MITFIVLITKKIAGITTNCKLVINLDLNLTTQELVDFNLLLFFVVVFFPDNVSTEFLSLFFNIYSINFSWVYDPVIRIVNHFSGF